MRMLSLTALLCAIAIAAAGCGGSDNNNGSAGSSADTKTSGSSGGGASDTSGGGGGKAQTLKLTADPGGALKFDKSSLTAKPGKIVIVMDNPSSLPHAVEVEGQGVEAKGATVGNGGVSKASATVKAGKYEYYCPVDGHRAAGMEGTLTVQ